MSFKVISGSPRIVQFPSDGSSTYYVGQLLSFTAASKAKTPGGVVPLAVAAGAYDTTNFQVVAGVVVGFNSQTPTYSSTWKANTETGVITQAAQAARTVIGNKGMYGGGDRQLLIDVALITQETLLQGPIFNAAYGTAPTVVSSTVATDTTGWTTAGTTGATDFTPVAYNCTAYCRTGANAGMYRTTNDTSTTAPDTDIAFENDVASGDTFVRVSLKQGLSLVQINGPGMYIDNATSGGTTNYFGIIVERLSLATAGSESADFRFAAVHFDPIRA